MNSRATPPRLQQKVVGYRDPTLDTFTDLKKALNEHLRKTDPKFLRDSDNSRRRAEERNHLKP